MRRWRLCWEAGEARAWTGGCGGSRGRARGAEGGGRQKGRRAQGLEGGSGTRGGVPEAALSPCAPLQLADEVSVEESRKILKEFFKFLSSLNVIKIWFEIA